MKRNGFGLVMALVLLWAFGLRAEEPKLKVSGYILADFQQYVNEEGKYSVVNDGGDWVAEGAHGFNQFEITRVYLTFQEDWNERFSTNVTTDVRVDSDGFSRLYLKYGYAELKNLWPNSKIRFGVQDPPWGSYIDNNLWRYRMIDQAFYSFWGTFSTADFGLGVLGSVWDKRLQYHLAVLNGEGYTKVENDRFKEYVGRISLDLGSPDKVRVYPSIGYSTHRTNDSEDFKDEVMMSALGIDFWRIHLAGEYLWGVWTMAKGSYPLVRGIWPLGAVDVLKATADSEDLLTKDKDVKFGGGAVYGDFKITDQLNLFARYDLYDPNTDSDYDRDREEMWMAGICYHPFDNLWISLDFRQMQFQEPDPDNDDEDELEPVQMIYTHWKIAY